MAGGRRLSGLADSELARLARGGDDAAFGELWQRHAGAGLAAARQFATIADPDDLVSEAYLLILRALQRGGGPSESFRPYLYRTIRNVALGWVDKTMAVPLDAAGELEDPAADPETATIRSTITVRAFRTLPERWQTVLWYTEVEGLEPADAAPLLGMTPNGVSALAYRAREGLKKAWLQAHVNTHRIPEQCRWTTERMGEYVRGGLSASARSRFDAHLETCTRCPILLEEIDELSGRLAVVLLPLALGGAAAAGLLATRSGPAVPVASQGHLPRAPRRPTRLGTVTALVIGATVVTVAGVAWAVASTSSSPAAVETDAPKPPPAPAPDPTASAPPTEPPEDPTDDAGTEPRAPGAPPASPAPPAPPVSPAPTRPAAPVVASPAPGTLTSDPTPSFTGTGRPGATVRLSYWDGSTAHALGSTVVPANGVWTLTPVAVPDGTWTFRVDQTRSGLASPPAQMTMTVDTVALAPVVAPLPAGPLVYLPTVEGTGEPGAVVTVRTGSGTLLASAPVAGNGTWAVPLPDAGLEGATVVASQTDAAGNVSDASVPTAAMQFAYPTLTPADGATVPSTGGSTAVSVELGGIPGLQVEVFVDGSSTGNLHTVQPTPLIRVTTPLPDGAHTIGVRYVDGAGRWGPTVTHTIAIAP